MGPRDLSDDMVSPAVLLDVLALQNDKQPIPDLISQIVLELPDSKELPENKVSNDDASADSVSSRYESHLRIGSQVTFPFFIAGMGMVGAGIYLDMVQSWAVFKHMPELIIMVPALLGLKGNLEMTLASRLSTECNIGHMNSTKEKVQLIFGNMTLLQCQSTVIGLLAAVVAILLLLIFNQQFNLDHSLILCACSMITATAASLILGLITSITIVTAKSFHINPDNVATPIAGSLGDITALVFLSLSASVLYSHLDKALWLCPIIIVAFIALLPLWIWLTRKNKNSRDVLYHGWIPILLAMVIAVTAGYIMDIVVQRSPSVAVFQPVVNGIGGNLVAVQASKMSTSLHSDSVLGELPPYLKICVSPIKVFFTKLQLATTARVLLFLVIPGHLTFIYTISFVKVQKADLSAEFVIFYLLAVFLQVAILLYIATILTSFFWSRKKNPDNMTIPYLTAIGDFLGICFLGVTFELLRLMGKEDVLV